MHRQIIKAEGHLIDTGILSSILNTILARGCDYRIISFHVGKTPNEISHLSLEICGTNGETVDSVVGMLKPYGVYQPETPPAHLVPADKDRHAPEGFYSTSNHRTEVWYNDRWHLVDKQRMDGALVYHPHSATFTCTKLREIQAGDLIVCGNESVRVYPAQSELKATERSEGHFAFMTQDVSSERSVEVAVDHLATDLKAVHSKGGKVVVVCGPVVVHTGGADALASLIRKGYIHGFLGGNAVAVHDVELRLFGTSLGVRLDTGEVTEHGHSHHMRAINRINSCGSMKMAIDQDILTHGLMYEVISNDIPYCLAGSIRDDGPLPETVMDMVEAQNQYAKIIEGADIIIMLASMLHAIGTGNMTPSWVKTICVDINPAVVTKLTDRGSAQTIGIVSDVGFFLRELARRLEES